MGRCGGWGCAMNSDAARDRMASIGYQPPGRRPSCRNCACGKVMIFGVHKHVRCDVLRAETACAGWCPRYTPVALRVAA